MEHLNNLPLNFHVRKNIQIIFRTVKDYQWKHYKRNFSAWLQFLESQLIAEENIVESYFEFVIMQ